MTDRRKKDERLTKHTFGTVQNTGGARTIMHNLAKIEPDAKHGDMVHYQIGQYSEEYQTLFDHMINLGIVQPDSRSGIYPLPKGQPYAGYEIRLAEHQLADMKHQDEILRATEGSQKGKHAFKVVFNHGNEKNHFSPPPPRDTEKSGIDGETARQIIFQELTSLDARRKGATPPRR